MIYKSIIVCFLIFCSFITRLNGQTHNPRLWYIGYQSPARDTNTIDTGIFLESGSTVLDFRSAPMKQLRVGNTLSIGDCNAFIFDDKDSLVLYSNGSKVFNRKHRLIEGADSLNYGPVDWVNSPFARNYFAEYYIRLYNQAITILPIPNQKNKYALISIFINGDTDKFYKITYSVLDMNLNSGLGKMTVKESTVALGDFTESINAVRHGNGRDWWVIAREYTNTCYKVMLLDSSGIKVVSSNQCLSYNLSDRNALNRHGITRFSWNGKQFVSLSYKGIEIYDFNRCTGLLSNRRTISGIDTIGHYEVGCFSSDNRLLYVNNGYSIYQIELSTLNRIKVAEWDGFKDTTGGYPFTTGFGLCQMAPDNKIYYGNNAFTHYLHRIENSNTIGLGCNVVQRAVKIQTLNSGIPHFPNFELGADTCWRSGIEDGKDLYIEVYPNPASDYVHIMSDSPIDYMVDIYNSMGQKVLSSKESKINVSALNNGIYLVKILDKREKIYLKKIRIQR